MLLRELVLHRGAFGFVDLGEAALVTETNDSIFSRAGLNLTNRVIRVLLPQEEQDAARARLAAVGEQVLAAAEPGSSLALHAALTETFPAMPSAMREHVIAWSVGRSEPIHAKLACFWLLDPSAQIRAAAAHALKQAIAAAVEIIHGDDVIAAIE